MLCGAAAEQEDKLPLGRLTKLGVSEDALNAVVRPNADYEPMTGVDDVFGPQSFHNGDYTFYYNNIRDNVAKRISAYLNSAK